MYALVLCVLVMFIHWAYNIGTSAQTYTHKYTEVQYAPKMKVQNHFKKKKNGCVVHIKFDLLNKSNPEH